MKLAFSSHVVAATVALALTHSAHAQAAHIVRVGVRPDGRQISPASSTSFASHASSLSDDGRFVIVTEQQFPYSLSITRVLDRATGTMAPMVLGLGGAPLDSYIGSALFSGDGARIAFSTDATNVVLGDSGQDHDVFVLDRATAQLTRASVGINGEPDSSVSLSDVNVDGRFTTFTSEASNLVAGDANFVDDIFRFDLQSGQVERVSVGTGGYESAGYSSGGAISDNGRWIAFANNGDDLTPGDTNGSNDVYVRDVFNGTTELVSLSSAGVPGDFDSAYASISGDGRFVAFLSAASNLVANDNNNEWDAFVRDRQAGTTVRTNLSTAGAEADSYVVAGRLSANGRFFVFSTGATNLVSNDNNNQFDVFLRDLVLNTTTRLNTTPTGGETSQTNWYPGIEATAITRDGRFVLLDSHLADLVAGDSNFAWDAFVVDRQSNAAAITAYCSAKVTSTGCTPAITSSGEPHATGWDSFYVSATQVRTNSNGTFAFSLSSASTPFGGGTLCLGAPVRRTLVSNSGSYGGTLGFCNQGQFVFKASQTFFAAKGILPGTTVYAQFISRDSGFATPNNVGLTDAIRFTLAP